MMRSAGDMQDLSDDVLDPGTGLKDRALTVHFLPH
jgi:hypothetical protein